MSRLRGGRALMLALLVVASGCAARHPVRCDSHLVPINPPPPKAAAATPAPKADAATPETAESTP